MSLNVPARPIRQLGMRRAGFTLTELLMVIAVITIISAILFPVFRSAKNRAFHTECADNLHQLGLAEHLYANDHDGWVPPATTAELLYTSSTRVNVPLEVLLASPSVLRASLDPYVMSDQVWFCPTDPYAHKNVVSLGQRHLLTSYWFFPRSADLFLVWPPRMQLMRDRLPNSSGTGEDIPLICDATGLARFDPQSNTSDDHATSNHPDSMVNIIRHDLSMTRKSAAYINGVSD